MGQRCQRHPLQLWRAASRRCLHRKQETEVRPRIEGRPRVSGEAQRIRFVTSRICALRLAVCLERKHTHGQRDDGEDRYRNGQRLTAAFLPARGVDVVVDDRRHFARITLAPGSSGFQATSSQVGTATAIVVPRSRIVAEPRARLEIGPTGPDPRRDRRPRPEDLLVDRPGDLDGPTARLPGAIRGRCRDDPLVAGDQPERFEVLEDAADFGRDVVKDDICSRDGALVVDLDEAQEGVDDVGLLNLALGADAVRRLHRAAFDHPGDGPDLLVAL